MRINSCEFLKINNAANHCAVPACADASVTVPVFGGVAVMMMDTSGAPQAELPVYVFNEDAYTGYTAVTDAAGEALIYAPAGAYRFAADIKGTLFYSDETNHCAIPGCETAEIEIPGGFEYQEVTIDYTYDGLYRLTSAEYSTGEEFEYTNDATGNRLTQTVTIDEVPVTTSYTYDEANRLSQVDAQAYTWDNNGNLLNDGQRQYYYDPANRLTALVEGEDTTYYLYNGQGDRIAQIEDDVQTAYILDLNAGLTQVLNDGTTAYVYGLDLVSQQTGINEEYPLRDALGSVRQVTDQSSAITGSRNYEPYGSVLSFSGEESMAYGFAGEWTDTSGMQYLRTRYYDPAVGRFVSRDVWEGLYFYPSSMNRWMYVNGNPVNLTDPSGMCYYDFNGDGRCDGEDIKLAVFVGSAQMFVAYHSRAQIESDFMTGAVSEGLRNVSWFIPPAQEALEASLCYENESMLMGRLTVDVLSVIGGGVGVGGGTALTGGGVVSCGTGVLCLAGAPAIAGGAVLAAEGAGVMSAGVTNFGDNISRIQQVNNEWNNSPGWKKLSESEIKILKKKGIDIHDLKGERHVGQWDLFKDANGNIYIKPKNVGVTFFL